MNEVLETMNEVLLDVETIASSLDMMMDEAFTQYMANILTESQVVDEQLKDRGSMYEHFPLCGLT